MKQAFKKNPKIAVKIRELLRNNLKMTVTQFSLLTGLDRTLVSRMANGKRYPSHDTWEKIVSVSKGTLTMEDWDEQYRTDN